MVPFNQREYDLFLSHAHADKAFVDKLYEWLTQKAGLHIWYDPFSFSQSFIAGGLQSGLEKCKGILLVNSQNSFAPGHGYVTAEYECALDLHAQDSNYRIIVVNTSTADKSKLRKGYTWIDMESDKMSLKLGIDILISYYGNNHITPKGAKDIYISCSWRSEDFMSAKAVCGYLINLGFRLIGDSKDQKGFDTANRIEKIIQSCGAFVSIIPFRNETVASADSGAYKYFIREIQLAIRNKIPTYVFVDPKIQLPDLGDVKPILFETSCIDCTDEVKSVIEPLLIEWENPLAPQYIFYSLDFEFEYANTNSSVRNLMERITALPTFTGREAGKHPIQISIVDAIKECFLLMADISDRNTNETGFNLNACIEVGMGIAARKNMEIIHKETPHRSPFMLRSFQIATYKDEFEMVGILHRILRSYRRRIINNELVY
ncbi:MAG: toll/interleukin-1 receptor domain-containing protein [Saprospiraceae bacterium]|nr:toll/interleukin-1 receptor domain-containing protein [Saprospiraceae bacterium]